jgi:hypothetical protein
LNGHKGWQSVKGVKQNAEHFNPPMLPFMRRLITTPKEANLWLLYDFEVKNEYLESV